MLAIDSTNIVIFGPLVDNITGEVVDDATCTGVVLDSTDEQVYPDSPGSFTLFHISEGIYRGTIAASASFDPDVNYTIAVTAVSGGEQLYKRKKFAAEYS